jgi:exodeoxyribonuclease VIII
MQTGIYYDLDFKAYRAMKDAVSISELNVYRRAALLYKHEVLDGNKRGSTPQQELGTALHAYYLERDFFDAKYRVGDKIDRRTKEGKAAFEERERLAKEEGFIFLDQEAMNKVLSAGKVLDEHPYLKTIKSKLKCEASMFWEKDGIKCRGRIDAFMPDTGVIVDLKTTKDAKNFSKSIIDYGYHRQAAYYLDGLKATTGLDAKEFIWVTIEMDAPHLCAIYRGDEMMIACGRHEYSQDLIDFKESQDKNEWAGLSTLVQTISLPTWYLKRAAEVEL